MDGEQIEGAEGIKCLRPEAEVMDRGAAGGNIDGEGEREKLKATREG